MSDIVPGTHVRMRITRRFSSYNVGELIAVPIEQGVELHAKRLAQPLDLLVPPPRETPPPEGAETGTAGPARQPAQVVRK